MSKAKRTLGRAIHAHYSHVTAMVTLVYCLQRFVTSVILRSVVLKRLGCRV